MRRRSRGRATITLLAAVLLVLPAAGRAAAQSDQPDQSTIVAMAQHFVQEQYMHSELGHYHIEFDVASVHPQPQTDFWAVVGGFVSDQTERNIYVAAVRLICPETETVDCWRLEKLAINNEIILDLGEPL